MNREFLINAIFLILVNLLIKPFYVFGIERVIQDRVGAESYGLYATLFSFTFLLFMVNDFGIHYYNNTTIAKHRQLAGKYFPNILVLKSFLTFLYLVLVFIAAFIRGFEPEVYYLLFFIAINHVLISMVAFLRSNISGLGMYRIDSVISTLDKLLLIGICAWLLWGSWMDGPFQIKWFVHAMNISWLLTAAVAFFVVKKYLRTPLRFRFNRALLWVIVKRSFPYALAVFLMTAYTRFDIVILEWIVPQGRYHAGVYAAAYRLLDAFNMVGYLFAGLLLPMFSTLLGKKGPGPASEERGELTSLLRFSLQLIWAGTVTLAVSSFLFQEELMVWLYPESVDASNSAYYGRVMGWLILTLVPFSGVFIYSTLLTANDSLKKMNRLFVGGIAVNLALNFLLIPSYQAVGAAVSAFSTQVFVMTGMMLLAKKELSLPMQAGQILKITGFIVLVALVSRQLYGLEGMDWLLKYGACILSGIVLAFLFRLIHLGELYDMVKK